jgi:hypothetical protein
MKKWLFLAFSMGLMLMGNAAWAKVDGVSANQNTKQEGIHFNLDLGEITHMSPIELSTILNDWLDYTVLEEYESELTCTASAKGKVNVGLVSVELTVEVSGPCDKIAKEGAKIANTILNELKKVVQ